MSSQFKGFVKGIRLRDNDDTGIGDISGSLTSADNGALYVYQNKIKAFLSAVEVEIATLSQTQTLTNKTIDADNNTISELETDNFKAGVISTDTGFSSPNNTSVPTTLATKTYVDDQIATVNEASEISYDNSTSGLTATDVQAAVDEVEGRVDTLESAAPAGDVVGTTDAQTLTNKTIDGDDNTLQDIALGSLKTVLGDANKVVTRDGSGAVVSTKASPTGDFIGTTDAQTITNKTIDGDDNTVQDLALTSLKTVLGDANKVVTRDGSGIVVSTKASPTGDFVGTTDTQTLTNKTLTSPDINTPTIDVQTLENQVSTPSNPSGSDLKIYAKDGKVFKLDAGGAESEIGSGGGGLDVWHREDFETTTASDFSTGNNATFLGGGTLDGTLADETSSPIAGDSSLKYTMSSSSTNDYVASPAITLDDKQKSNSQSINLYYTYDGDDDDIEMVVWDVTNSDDLASNFKLKSKGSATRGVASFYIPSSATTIRWGFQVTTGNNTKILIVDDVEFSSDPFTYKNLVSRQYLTFSESQSSLADRVNQIRFSGALTDADFSGDSILQIVDDAANTRTKFTALRSGTVHVSYSFDSDAASTYATATLFDDTGTTVFEHRGSESDGAADNCLVAASFKVEPGYFITVGSNGTARSTAEPAKIVIAAEADSEHIVTPTQVPRQYSEADGDFTITGSGWTTTRAVAVYYRTGEGSHRLKFNIGGTKAAAAGATLTFSGVTFKNSNNQSLSASAINSTAENTSAYAVTNSSTIEWFTDGSGVANPTISGDVELESKPTWAGDVSLNYLSAIPVEKTAYVKDVKSNGTNGGTFTNGAWQTRVLNTLEGDTGFISLSTNQFTLDSGKYEIEVSAPAVGVNVHKAKLVADPSGSPSDVILGINNYDNSASTYNQSCAIVKGQVVISESTAFEVQHRCGATNAANGFGNAMTFGVDEVYTVVKITKIL